MSGLSAWGRTPQARIRPRRPAVSARRHHLPVTNVLLAPYVAIPEPVSIGDWVLLPILGADSTETVGEESDQIPSELRRAVRRLVDAYRVRDEPGLGALVAPPGGHVGAAFSREDMRRLGHAILAGVLGANPELRTTEDGSLGGWSIATSENAVLYGHPITDGDSYALQTGVLIQVLSAFTAESDEPLPKISPPVELPKPMMSRFDGELAAATWQVLGEAEAAARRLSRALDWYKIALANAEAITLDVRVGAARSALEVLLDAGDSTQRLVRRYGDLTRTGETEETTHTDVFWAKGPVPLTPDEWWMHRLCELRNAIVHGDDIPDELWEHDGSNQLVQIHDRLIGALRIFVAQATGDQLLALPLGDRGLRRAWEEALDDLPDSEPDHD